MKELCFSQLTESQFHHKKITIDCMVVGKFDPVYTIPKFITVDYVDNNNQHIVKDLTIEEGDEKILSFIGVPTTHHPGLIKKYFNINIPKDVKFNYTVKDNGYQTILRFAIAGLTGEERSSIGNKPLIVYCVYVNDLKIEDNCSYKLEGYRTVDPKNQETVCVFNKATKIQSDIENFKVEDFKEDLRIFRPKKIKKDDKSPFTADEIFNQLKKLCEFYSTNITGVRGDHRFDAHLAVYLTFHSVCNFEFEPQRNIEKGWMDVMLLGDEGTGKSTISEKFLDYYGMGERITGQNTSFAGLVGGNDEISGYRIPNWGKFPLNDKGLLVVDEAGHLDPIIFNNLDAMRSSGKASMSKMVKGEVNARTRVIWTSNPKDNGRVGNKYYGITSLSDLITQNSSIRRFDLVVICAKRKEDNIIPNKVYTPEAIGNIWPTKEQDRNLVRWAWSRKLEDIIFTPQAKQTARELAEKLGEEYSPKIPLILGQDFRIKLARLAIAIAVCVFSHVKGHPNKVLVGRSHMECAEKVINLIYGKDENGYKTYSKFENDKITKIEGADFSVVRDLFRAYGQQQKQVMEFFMQANKVTAEDFMIWMGYPDKKEANKFLGEFLRARCLQSTTGGYLKTPPFVRFLKSELLNRD